MLQFVQSPSTDQQLQPYGAPLAPPQTHIQMVQAPTQNHISQQGVATGNVLRTQQFPSNFVVTDQQGPQRLVTQQQNAFQQNVISPNTFVQSYSYSRPQSRQQTQPVQTIVQQLPAPLPRASIRQEEQLIIRSPQQQQQQQQPHIFIQQPQSQEMNQQVILQTPQPQQFIVQAPQQFEPHSINVQAQQQQQQQVMHYQQQQQPHQQQQITQTINLHSQTQQVAPHPHPPVISVAPVSLNLPEETGGIFQLAHVRSELLQSPKNQDMHVQKAHLQQAAGSSLVARTILGQDDEVVENGFIQQAANQLQQFQQQQQQVKVVRDEGEVLALREKIKILLDNVQELNKTIDVQEQETQDLYARLLELDHLRRSKALVDEENEALKLQIQEWQKRYNVLELTLYEKPTSNIYATGSYYNSEDNSKILNTLKIKQEENEILKTTIARLELNQTSERNLKEEIHRLNDLLWLRTSQCEEWKNKYLNLEQVHFQQMAFDPQQYSQQQQEQQQHQQFQYEIQGVEQQQQQQIQQRGRSPVAYETSALFKKKNDQNISNFTSNQVLSNGIASYLEDYKSNKAQ